ncbi:MAG TPA: hydrogenase maturation nickel metallochaperone HypA [Symbiobacteriaceae bacterium]|nr:hydrogenase maturation nickel metallochaperone HypA [Symbiobacteriaceae bacterium]
MHEFSLAQSIADLVTGSAREEGISRIRRVTVLVGEWSAVLPDALTTSFAAIAGVSGPILEGAEMVVQISPAMGECAACGGLRFPASEGGLTCPGCKGGAILVSGTELRVDSYEGD